MTAAEHAIRFDTVSKSFGNQLVLDGVSFDVPHGDACCIMGRSGSGKSVTLKLLLGLLKPDEGKIHVNDVAIETLYIHYPSPRTSPFHFAATPGCRKQKSRLPCAKD